MFTVLIAEKEHIDAIRQENKLFFEPFLEKDELAFCYWNLEGQNLQDSVPGLMDAVGRKKDWRAVILNSGTPETLKQRNPFDVVDRSGLDALTHPPVQPPFVTNPESAEAEEELAQWESGWEAYYEALSKARDDTYRAAMEFPLQKLATWLCFRAEDYVLSEVRETKNAQDWAMEQLEANQGKTSVKLETLERKQYKETLHKKESIRRAFVAENCLNIAYPMEVQCISARTSDQNFFDPGDYWNVWQESDYSTFADRNMYFDKMRFMVFDLLPKSHRNYRTDHIRFLASVLLFASNPTPSSAMQARRLYRLEAETDDTPLYTLVTSYDRKLAATADVIERQMEQIRGSIPDALTDKAAEALFCTPQDVAVVLDESCEPENVLVEKDYGLFYDAPENEFQKWTRSYRNSGKALAYIAKQQHRSVRKSVNQMHFSSEVADVNINRLTPLQIEDIRDYTDAAEDELVASIPPDLTDISRYTKKLEEESESVKKVLDQRMTKKTTLILGGVCLGLFLICFLPFLFSNVGTPRSVSTAIVLIGVMLGIMAGVLFVTLLVLRSDVTNAVKSYNNAARGVLNDIQTGMKRFSQYLSAACNVRRGHSVQTYAQKNVDVYTRSLRIRKKHWEDIRKKRAFLAESYQDYMGDHSYCDEVMARAYDYDFDQRTEYTYPAPFLAGDSRQIEFLSSGNFVTAPSSYIKRILVRMEGIYDK